MDKADDKKKGGKGEKRRGGGEDGLDGALRHRLPKILKEYEERLKVLRAVHRRVINRCAKTNLCLFCQLCKECQNTMLICLLNKFFFLINKNFNLSFFPPTDSTLFSYSSATLELW